MQCTQLGTTFTTSALVSKTKYEYVKEFEREESCLPNCWIVVRISGRNFFKFAETHKFSKPNDIAALELMNCAATTIMEEIRDIILAYGQSDEFSFVIRKDSQFCERKPSQLLSAVNSLFSAAYVYNWPYFFKNTPLFYPPAFDARVILYPTDKNLRDYLAWRQADIHINNLYNTCFWNLVIKKKMPPPQAQEMLKGTLTTHKMDLLKQEFGIIYDNEPNMFRQGTTLIRKLVLNNLGVLKPTIIPCSDDIINDRFWKENPEIIGLKGLVTYQGPPGNLQRCHRPNVNSELQPNLPNYSGTLGLNLRDIHQMNALNHPGNTRQNPNHNHMQRNSKFRGNNSRPGQSQTKSHASDNSRNGPGPVRSFGSESNYQNKTTSGPQSSQVSQNFQSESYNQQKNFNNCPYQRRENLKDKTVVEATAHKQNSNGN